MLCSLILNGLIKSLQELKLDPGSDFQIIMISIDPNESPDLAAAKKRAYLKRYGRSRSPTGWHFLTGTQDSITRVTTQTGFHYAYDEAISQYAHPSGLIILTPQGRISRYLFGVDYPARELYNALNEAASGRIGSPIRQFILLCFHYQPLTGPYGAIIMRFVRFGGVAMLLVLAAVITMVGRRRPQPPSTSPAVGRKTSEPGP
jgi:protein SCO1/2